MASPFYQTIAGKFVIVGKQPDGDSVRFIADHPDYEQLQRSFRIKLSRDRSVQLRLEGIDTPEVHYGSDAQILGDKARDRLLDLIGFYNIKFKGNQVQSAEPDTVSGAILSQAADANGRPISYVLVGESANQVKDGKWTRVDTDLLRTTINFQMLTEGAAYYTVYTSTPLEHRRLLRQEALSARNDNLGVWAEDATSEFELVDKKSITAPNGQLILPKLFRRSLDFLKAVDKGFRGNLKDWLIENSKGSRNENDRVVTSDGVEINLSDLIQQRNSRVAFQADLLNITFVEK